MTRCSVFAALFLSVALNTVATADWTDTAFPVKSHDFGTVAVAATTEFRFPVVNSTDSTMHIRTVRASCGCTTPIVETPYINPGQTGTILARFNTDTFKGKHGATLTVVIDQPYYTEFRLRVDGYIRKDMVFHPGAIEFGKIDQGDSNRRTTKVLYAGRDDWQIVDVRSNRPWLNPEFKEVSRGGGRVTYEISVDVGADAEGFFQDELIVMTNDRTMPKIPLRVTGQVQSALTISPRSISLGSLKPGESVQKRMVLIGKQPFTVGKLEAEGWEIKHNASPEAKKTHVLLTEFTPMTVDAGPLKTQLRVSAADSSISANALLTADIREQ